MRTRATAHKTQAHRSVRSALFVVVLALGAALAAPATLAGTAQQADAALTEKVVFSSNRTTGTGVDNLTGDREIFRMNPDGSGVRQLTFNQAADFGPKLSPDGTRVVYESEGIQTSNPEGDEEVYVMNAVDGNAKKNLTNNGVEVGGEAPVEDYFSDFSPDGKKIVYNSEGVQNSNPEGDHEIYSLNAPDGTDQQNLTDNGQGVSDGIFPD